MALQMLTANRLTDGAVLYWQAGGWVETLAAGDVFATQAQADAALALAQAFVTGNAVVGTYLFDVDAAGSPVKEREIIRARGPSVRDDLGKQASSNLPLEGRSKREALRVGGGASAATAHPENPPDFSTSPQGGGEMDSFDVSI